MREAEAVEALSALAQSTRMQAFRRLVKAEPDGICVGDLAHDMGIPQNTLSTHLAILSRAGLVRAEKRERSVFYRPQLEIVSAITLFLLKDCCGGQPSLCAPISSALSQSCKPSVVRKAPQRRRA
jgi:DNA-binding transcriptional ArsR family regulator